MDDSKPVRNLRHVLLLLFLNRLRKTFIVFRVEELRVLNTLTQQPVARNDVAFNDLTQISKVFLTDLQLGANGGPWRFLFLLYVYVHDILLPELPRERYVVV